MAFSAQRRGLRREVQVEVCRNEIPESSWLETAVKKEAWLHDACMLNLESAM